MKTWMELLVERLNIKTMKMEYECGCSYLWDVQHENELAWKPIDYTLCETHLEKIQSSASSMIKDGEEGH